MLLNGKKVGYCAPVEYGDILTLGGVELFFTFRHSEQAALDRERKRPVKRVNPLGTLLFSDRISGGARSAVVFRWARRRHAVPVSFLALIAMTLFCYFLTRLLRRVAFELRRWYFLCTLGTAVTASSAPDQF